LDRKLSNGGGLLVTANYPTGGPNIFERLTPTGPYSFTDTPFGKETDGVTPLSGAANEVYLAAVTKDAAMIGGWTFGDVLFCRREGQVSKVNGDGTGLVDPFATLTSTKGPVAFLRGSLVLDRVGTFGGDLLVTDDQGWLFRIKSNGSWSEIVLPSYTDMPDAEGSLVVPNDPGRWGALAGTFLTASEGSSRIFSITPAGSKTAYQFSDTLESISLLKPGFSYYGVAFSQFALAIIPAEEWKKDTRFQNSIIVGSENGNLYLLEWNSVDNVPTLTPIPMILADGEWPGVDHITQFEGADAAAISELACVDTQAPVFGSQCDYATEKSTGKTASLTIGSTVGPCNFVDGVPQDA